MNIDDINDPRQLARLRLPSKGSGVENGFPDREPDDDDADDETEPAPRLRGGLDPNYDDPSFYDFLPSNPRDLARLTKRDRQSL